jgi:hypothetical protein
MSKPNSTKPVITLVDDTDDDDENDEIPVTVLEMTFSGYSFHENETQLKNERKRKVPILWQNNNDNGNDNGSDNSDDSDNHKSSTTDQKNRKQSDEQVTCMICNRNLNAFSISERFTHVNRCIDEGNEGNEERKSVNKSNKLTRNDSEDSSDPAFIFSPNSSASMLAVSASNRTKGWG